MANQEHLDLLKQGIEAWNRWRIKQPNIQPDLSNADLREVSLHRANLSKADLRKVQLHGAQLHRTSLRKANLSGAHLRRANFHRADLTMVELRDADLQEAILSEAHLNGAVLRNAKLIDTDLYEADLRLADLSGAHLMWANLYGANLSKATLYRANFSRADLSNANLSDANLREVNLSAANLSEADLRGADLTGCRVYATSVWNVQLKDAIQSNLVITQETEASITVDNLEVAQFIYLLLNNQKIREVINTITSKVVLILGCFTPERKAVLDALREALRTQGYLPILFDFEKPASRDITETVSTLAHLARFVVADLTDARSIPQELKTIVPNLPSVPVQPLILASQHEYGMFEHFVRFPWVLPVYHYTDEVNLLQSLQEKVITPAEQKAKELEKQ